MNSGYGYVPRANPGNRPEMMLDTPTLIAFKGAVANTFTSLRFELGEEISIESMWKVIDEAILAQPGVFKKPDMEGMSPATLAQKAYEGGG